MEIYRSETGEGISFVAARTDRFKSGLLTASFAVPLDGKTASGYSLLTNLLSLATAKHRTMQSLASVKDELYALSLDSYVRRSGERLLVTLEMSMLGDSFALPGDPILEKSIALFGEMLLNPCVRKGGFPKSQMESEKAALIEEIDSIIEHKNAFALQRTRELLCAGEPFAVNPAGDRELVAALTGEEVYGFYRRVVESAPVTLIYVGEAEPKTVEALIKKHIPLSGRCAGTTESTLHPIPDEVRRVRETMSAGQSVLAMGFCTADKKTQKERMVAAAFDEMFGNSATSRLFVNVREKHGLCYYCSSRVASEKNVMFVSCGVSPGNEEKAENAILNELSAMQNGEFSDADLHNAVVSLSRAIRGAEGSLSAISLTLLVQSMNNSFIGIDESIALVKGITREEIISFAKSIVPDTVYVLAPEAL